MNYNEIITSTPTVLVEFYASWCPHCQRMMPIVAQIKQQLDGKTDVHQFDIDENQHLADSHHVESIPTFIVYRHGKEMWRQTGEIKEDALLAKIKEYS